MFVFVPMGGLFIVALPIIIAAMGLTLIYFFIPTHSLHLISAFKAGVLSAFLLEVVKSIMLIYINYFPIYKIIYGAFAFVLLFILWVYLSWIIILFGMSYCKTLEEHYIKIQKNSYV